ncbi:MAG: hypothetical protein K2M19_01025 [Muribaculaceae bacterium]|nr:hypothetical protein [Muribaculaceae bacterium]
MKIKAILTLMVAGALAASAQSQGYKDGVEYYKAGQYDNARTILQNTLNNSDTDKALANYYLGQTELALGNKAEAAKYFNAGVAADAENPYNYVGLGSIDLLNGNESAAKDNFKKAQNFGKKNHEITVSIARAYFNADPVKFAKELDSYLAKAHKDSKHSEPSIYILEGDMAVANKDFGAAAGKYEMATGYDSANPEGYVKYANSYFHVNPQFSIQKLEEFLKVAPNSALGQRELAEKYYEANFWNKAAEQYGKYIQNPNHFPQDKARYAVLLYYGEKYPESLKVSKEVLAQQPDNFQVQRLIFLNETQLGQFEQAVKDGQAFFAKNPNGRFTSNDYTTLSDAYAGAGQDSLAVVEYEKAVVAFPDNADLVSSLSTLYGKNKQYEKSAQAYDKYVALLEEPSVNDLFTGSGRWLNVAATAGDNQALRASAAAKGVEYVNKVIERAEPSPVILQRKARLQLAENGNTPNADAIATYDQMLAMLDAIQGAKDATNPDNSLPLYKEAYMFNVLYYTQVEPDKDKAAEFSGLLKDVNEALGQ